MFAKADVTGSGWIIYGFSKELRGILGEIENESLS